MPDIERYKRIKADPVRYSHYLTEKKEWMKKRRKKRVFMTMVERMRWDLKTPVFITAFDLWKLAKKQKLICALTGRKLTRETISVDHITPYSRGGSNGVDNLRMVHIDANMAKQNLADPEFLQLCREVVSHSGSLW